MRVFTGGREYSGKMLGRMSAPTTLLVIDDDVALLELIQEGLAIDGLEVLTCADASQALRLVASHHPRIVLLDLILPGVNGMELLEKILEIDRRCDVILMTGAYSTDSAVEAIQRGACDYLAKPVPMEKLRERIGRLLAEARRREETLELDRKLLDVFQLEGIVGRSPAMLEVFTRIRRVAPHFRTVLVTGPTGSGKELVARVLHRGSPVRGGPFAVCNCAAVVETLFESELFGYTKGAFTGALQDKVGLFEYASGGVLVLDEIGEMPLPAQAKLLRVLQQQEVQRLGSPQPRKVDVRVVASTNRNLREMVSEGKFREDLYFRLAMVTIKLPSLRERLEDLPLLERHLVAKFAAQYGKPIQGLTRRAQALLSNYGWPGNVRELENVIGHGAMMTETSFIDVQDIADMLREEGGTPGQAAPGGGFSCDTRLPLAEVERRYIGQVLQEEDNNVAQAAARLGVPRSTLYQRLKEMKEGRGSP